MRGYTFYDRKISGTELYLFTNAIRIPVFLKELWFFKLYNSKRINKLYFQSGIAQKCSQESVEHFIIQTVLSSG